jgi:D-methionine transport system permease protein
MNQELVTMLTIGFAQTLYMTLASSIIAYLFGLPMGVLLVITDKDGIAQNQWLNMILGTLINILRSVPFLILLIAVIPLTRWITGTTLGPTATLVPLVIGSAPFIARLVEGSLKEVDHGVIEAAHSMGTSTWQIIYKVLLPEAKPSLIQGGAIAVTTILGYSAMTGFVGGGGLGDLAIRYGYYRYQTGIMIITVALLVIIVQFLQGIGLRFASKSDKRKR